MHPIAHKIATLRRRITYRAYATAVCLSATAMLAAAIALGLTDYLVRFRDPGLRILATTALAAVAAVAAYRWWLRPGRKRLSSLAVARRVESHFPQLNDALASAVEFLDQSERDETAGSAQLRRIVVAEAESATAGLPLYEVIDRRPLRRASFWFLAACVLLGLFLAWDAAAVRTAFARLIAPLGGAQWPRRHHLEFRNPPTSLAAGQTFEVELFDTSGELPDEVRIAYQSSNGNHRKTSSEPMIPVGGVMVARRENIRESFAFRATGGDDDVMNWHRVEVVEPPRLKSLAITVHPPDYTGLPPLPAERHLNVLAGTQIELHGTATEPLGGARILRDGEKPIAATISKDVGGEANAFQIAPRNWIATKTIPYSLELADTAGIAGVIGQWNLHVEQDPPPTVSWQLPSDNLYVTPNAVIPIELVVKDNLAVARIELIYERSDWSEAERERAAPTARIALYRGPEKPQEAAASANAASARSAPGESRAVDYSWDLAPLQIPPGAEFSISAEAADYRPGAGRTAAPRRITIITADELDARIADQLSQIGRQLERALTIQRSAREDIRRQEVQHNTARSLTSGDRSTLQSAELNQRRVERTLVDPNEGVPNLVEALARDLDINRITQSDVRAAMDRLSADLSQLVSGPLADADRELTSGRKASDEAAASANGADKNQPALISLDQAEALTRALTAAGAAQDDVIVTLERLVSELSGKSDYRRFARILAELHQDQLAHEKATRTTIGVATLPLRVNDLTRAQRVALTTAAAGQTAIATRYTKIEQGMDALAQELARNEATGADELAAAVELARSLAIGSRMVESARDIHENRIGSALDREVQTAADLQQVLDVLRGKNKRQPDRVADNFQQAQEQLDGLRKQLANLRREISNLEKQVKADTKQQQQNDLSNKQQTLRREIEKLARQIAKLKAPDASQSAQSAANRLDHQNATDNASPQQQPAFSSEVQKAEEDLATAAQQLANRRQQAEDDLALEFIRRLQTELADMVERQKSVVDQTTRFHDQRPPNAELPAADAARITKLAEEERALAQMAKDHSEVLHGLGAVRVSLEEAERRLLAAAALLDDGRTGPDAQQAERHALARLEGMLETFAQTANEAQQGQPTPPNPNANAQRRPTFELLEIKMLRLLQIDLQNRTREYQQQVGRQSSDLVGRESPGPVPPANLQREAQQLAAEQGRLAELVEDILTRDNKEVD